MIDTFRADPSALAVGDEVRATKALRQDGTYPDPAIAVGQVLVGPGTAGRVLDVGLYLGAHVVYAVAFENGRVVGCLEGELDLLAHEDGRAPLPSVPGLDVDPAAPAPAAEALAAPTTEVA